MPLPESESESESESEPEDTQGGGLTEAEVHDMFKSELLSKIIDRGFLRYGAMIGTRPLVSEPSYEELVMGSDEE